MDNFMDKLAKRFNAGDIIKANAQAEARELKRLQAQAEQYDKMMQEVRRLNLKNVEVTEQVQQLIQCGIEQIEGYGTSDEILVQSVKDTEAVLVERIEAIPSFQISDLDELKDTVIRQTNDNMIKLEAFEGALEDVLIRNQQTLEGLLLNINDKVAGTTDQSADFENIHKSLEESRFVLLEQMNQTKEMLITLRMNIEDGQKRLEEHVHKENVRVYRNVQAVVTEEATKKTRDLGDRLDVIARDVERTKGVKPLLWISIILALGNLGVIVAQIMHLI